MKWVPTPEEERIVARVLAGDGWVEREMKDLRPGDVFRMLAPDGDLVHPSTFDPDPECVCVAVDWPIKCDPMGSTGQTHGYGVAVDIYDSLDELRRRGLS